jgi:hypothetical protein
MARFHVEFMLARSVLRELPERLARRRGEATMNIHAAPTPATQIPSTAQAAMHPMQAMHAMQAMQGMPAMPAGWGRPAVSGGLDGRFIAAGFGLGGVVFGLVALGRGISALTTLVSGGSFLDAVLWSGIPGAMFGIGALAFFGVAARFYLSGAKRVRLAQEGLRGTARIVSVRDTGTRLNDAPMLELDVMVSVEGRAPYAARLQEVIPLHQLGAMQPGTSIGVLVDRQDPTQIVAA